MLIRTVAVEARTGLEVRCHPVGDPGTVLARVSRTSRWVAEDLPVEIATVVRVIVDGVVALFAQREYEVIRALGGPGPVGSTIDRRSGRSRRR